MDAEGALRVAVWVLLAGVVAKRAISAFQVRRAGERLLPNREAVEREGRGMVAARAVAYLAYARRTGRLLPRLGRSRKRWSGSPIWAIEESTDGGDCGS